MTRTHLMSSRTLWILAAVLAFSLAPPPEEALGYRSVFREGGDRVQRKGKGGQKSKQLFGRIQHAYLAGDTDEVLSEGARFLDRYPKHKLADQVLHTMALASLEEGNSARVREDLLKLKSFYPKSRLGDRVELAIGDSYLLDSDIDGAIGVWSRALREYPESTYHVLYLDRLAQAYKKKGKFQLARKYLKEMVKRYPDSVEARGASRTLTANTLFFTVQVGSFSKRTNAEKVAQALRGIGMEPRMAEKEDGNRTFYRVRVGRFGTKSEAEILAARLRKKGYLTKIYP